MHLSPSSNTSQPSRSSADTARTGRTSSILPPLPYTLHTPRRQRRIAFVAILFLLEAGVLPLVLFYALKLGAHLSVTANLAIITGLVGTFSGYRFGMRMLRMWIVKNSANWRPIGAGRWGVDASQVLISIGLGGFFVPLIIGSSLQPASPPTVAMALPCLMITLCFPLFITGLWHHRIRFPLRISSLPAYEPLPPFTYTYVEDIVAVDGGGGLEFREAWRIRYEASTVMRELLRNVALAWGFSGCLIAAALIIIAWMTSENVGYGIGYGVPWIWAICLTAWTIWYSRMMLKKEREEWDTTPELVHREVSLHIREGNEGEKRAENAA